MASTPERLSSLETDLKGHKDQCVTDKQEIKGRFDSIDNKLWAIFGAIIMHLVVVVGYLVTQGTPWEPAKTIIADRGERK
jgi:hypothetical protein